MCGKGLIDARLRAGIMPDKPCWTCGTSSWWWRSNQFGAEHTRWGNLRKPNLRRIAWLDGGLGRHKR